MSGSGLCVPPQIAYVDAVAVAGISGDGGPANLATLNLAYPGSGVAVVQGATGDTIYLADTGNHRLMAFRQSLSEMTPAASLIAFTFLRQNQRQRLPFPDGYKVIVLNNFYWR